MKAKHRSNNAKLKSQLSDTEIELKSKAQNFDIMEEDLSLKITKMNLSRKNNELEIAEFMKVMRLLRRLSFIKMNYVQQSNTFHQDD